MVGLILRGWRGDEEKQVAVALRQMASRQLGSTEADFEALVKYGRPWWPGIW